MQINANDTWQMKISHECKAANFVGWVEHHRLTFGNLETGNYTLNPDHFGIGKGAF